jgi:hypothetical protein
MNRPSRPPYFWSDRSPLVDAAYLPLLLAGSGRLAYALTLAALLLLCYPAFALASLALRGARPSRGAAALDVFLAAAVGAVGYAAIALASPVMAGELAFPIGLVPVTVVAARLGERYRSEYWLDAARGSALEAAVAGVTLIVLALVREPFGYGALSLPGVFGAVVVLGSDAASLAASRVIATASGAFLVLAYLTALYRFRRFRRFRNVEPEASR